MQPQNGPILAVDFLYEAETFTKSGDVLSVPPGVQKRELRQENYEAKSERTLYGSTLVLDDRPPGITINAVSRFL
jgi:hypothetical protein